MRKLALAVLLSLGLVAPAAAQVSVTSGLTTATTLTQIITGDSRQATIITGWSCAATAASTATADQQCRLKYGTGTNCGTGTTDLDGGMTPAAGTFVSTLTLRVPPGQNVCYMHAVVGSKIFTISYRRQP